MDKSPISVEHFDSMSFKDLKNLFYDKFASKGYEWSDSEFELALVDEMCKRILLLSLDDEDELDSVEKKLKRYAKNLTQGQEENEQISNYLKIQAAFDIMIAIGRQQEVLKRIADAEEEQEEKGTMVDQAREGYGERAGEATAGLSDKEIFERVLRAARSRNWDELSNLPEGIQNFIPLGKKIETKGIRLYCCMAKDLANGDYYYEAKHKGIIPEQEGIEKFFEREVIVLEDGLDDGKDKFIYDKRSGKLIQVFYAD